MNLKKRYKIELPSLYTLGFVLIIGLIIGYLGPFGSYELSLSKRLIYWVLSILVGYFIYSHTFKFGQWFFADKKVHRVVKLLIPSLIAALVLSFFVEFITNYFFTIPDSYTSNFLDFFLQVFIIGLIISFISTLFHKSLEKKDASTNEPNVIAGKVFLDRLPHNLGDELFCFVMEDHYLKVTTKKGEHMLLMRMKDALVELSDYDGLQVHRSWWIARDAVARSKKSGRNTILVLENDLEVPVSKTYLNSVKEAGLL